MIQEAGNKLEIVEFSKVEVIKQLENLKVDKSPGIENLHPKLLCKRRTEVREALANLFVKSFESGSIPRDW